jgi:hypothetical protein
MTPDRTRTDEVPPPSYDQQERRLNQLCTCGHTARRHLPLKRRHPTEHDPNDGPCTWCQCKRFDNYLHHLTEAGIYDESPAKETSHGG